MLRSTLKRATEWALVHLGVGGIARKLNRGRIVVLAYHNIVPRGEPKHGDASLHLDQEAFARQLDLLGRTHDVVPLASLEDPPDPAAGVARRPQAAITFDDAYRGALTAGLEETGRRGMPATVFVAPGLLGARGFWWDLLAAGADGGVADTVREHALSALGGRQADILAWARAGGLPQRRHVPDHARPADPALLRSISRRPDVSLGSHTWSHPNLCALSPGDVVDELVEPVKWFEAHDLPLARWLAYPYGLVSPVALDQARKTHSLAFTTVARMTAVSPDLRPDPMTIPRVNVPAGASLERFRLLTAGLFDLVSLRDGPS